ncbi:MAG: S8 family serine peptidase [Candidatus Sericytochromatia bacterium]
MKQLTALVLSFGLMAALSGPVAALPNDVLVTFKPGVSTQYVQTLSQTFQASVLEKVDENTWRFKIPPLRTQDQYAELFASLPVVMTTQPMPVYKVADHINPQVVNVQPLQQGSPVRSQDYLPGEMLVKFKPTATADDIRFLNSHNGISQISRIGGIDVYRLRLPQQLSVEEALALYNQSGIVEYAEPNYKMSLPNPIGTAAGTPDPSASPAPNTATNGIPNGNAVITPIPMDGGGQMIVYFKPNTPRERIALFHKIYGTREVKQQSFYAYRIQLPAGLDPARAGRIFKLFPSVTNVQRLYA